MYRMQPVVKISSDEIKHTDSMFKVKPPIEIETFSTVTNISVTQKPIDDQDLDKFVVSKCNPRSKLGRKMQEDKKDSVARKIFASGDKTSQQFQHTQSETLSNDMLLDKFIIRKTAASSKLGKFLQTKNLNPISSDEDRGLRQRLEEMDKQLDSILMHMTPVHCSRLAPANIDHPCDPKTEQLLTQRLKDLDNRASDILSCMSGKTPLPISFSGNQCNLIDLAIHCDPSKPPFAILLFSKLFKISGRKISLQFYRHSSLVSFPSSLSNIEHFFAGCPRSSTSEVILSIIWKPYTFGCKAISNPFTELPVYGQEIILMLLTRLAPHASQFVEILSKIDSQLINGSEKEQTECLKAATSASNSFPSIIDAALFVCCIQKKLVPLVNKISKVWFDNCMKNDVFVNTKKIIESC